MKWTESTRAILIANYVGNKLWSFVGKKKKTPKKKQNKTKQKKKQHSA